MSPLRPFLSSPTNSHNPQRMTINYISFPLNFHQTVNSNELSLCLWENNQENENRTEKCLSLINHRIMLTFFYLVISFSYSGQAFKRWCGKKCHRIRTINLPTWHFIFVSISVWIEMANRKRRLWIENHIQWSHGIIKSWKLPIFKVIYVYVAWNLIKKLILHVLQKLPVECGR